MQEIQNIHERLSRWRESIPGDFRPGQAIRLHRLARPLLVSIALRLHLFYYNMLIAISRLCLHVCGDHSSEQQIQSTRTLMEAARSMVDLTQHIVCEPYTPTWFVMHTQLLANMHSGTNSIVVSGYSVICRLQPHSSCSTSSSTTRRIQKPRETSCTSMSRQATSVAWKLRLRAVCEAPQYPSSLILLEVT